MTMKLKKISAIIISLFLGIGSTVAQDTAATANNTDIVIEPLFEYPTAPEELGSLGEKSDYLMLHFWDAMDFKNKKPVDQYALTHAFSVYAAAIPYASKEAVEQSTRDILKKLQKNPSLLLQFTKAAEENIYSDRARFWVDEVYIPYLRELVKAKKIDSVRKLKYERQLKLLSNSQPGERAREFNFQKPDGTSGLYFPMSSPTLIEFGNPDCMDCRMSRLKMESNAALNAAIDKGLVNVLFIIPDATEGWEKEVTNYNSKWTVGASDDVADIYDIRLSPTFYVIGKDGKIIAKNIGVETAISLLLENTPTEQEK